MSNEAVNNEVVRMEHITKTFTGVKAVDDVSFSLYEGEIHALMGANGAGKSTLMKVLAGVYLPDAGELYRDGKAVPMRAKISEAQKDGTTMVFQELNILPHLSVLENIFIANEITNKGIYNWKAMRSRASEIMNEVGIHIDLEERAGNLSVAMQQMVEILRALNLHSKTIIFDEPTSSLSMQETDQLFDLMRRLKEKKVGMVYISHRMDEIYRICDRITLMRDGRHIFTDVIANVDSHKLIAGIVGKENTNQFPEKNRTYGKVIFEAQNVTCNGKYEDVSFQLREGEILGFAGMVGAGRTEIAKTIFGCLKLESGKFLYHDKELHVKNPKDAVNQGIGYVSEDRKAEGILSVRSIKENMGIANMHHLVKMGKIQHKSEQSQVNDLIKKLKIKTTGLNQKIENLSGGNQQKVCLGKWIMTNPGLLILDEPTRGIDVGARADFYHLIHDLVEQKIGVIVISSEEDELIGLCNRIVVMRNGKKISEYEDTEESLKPKMMKDILNI